MSFVLIFFITFISIVWFLYANYWFIEWILIKLYFTNDFLLYIKDNLKYIITISFTYLIFISYIWRKKGKIFSDEWWLWIEHKYSGAFLLIYQLFNFFLVIHILFLFHHNTSGELYFIKETVLLFLYFINYFLIYWNYKKDYLSKRFYLEYIFLWILLIIIPFLEKWYLEILFLFIISSVLIPLGHKLVWVYVENHNNKEFLALLNKSWRKNDKDIIESFSKSIKDWELLSEINTLYVFFLVLVPTISFSFVLSIITPIIWFIYSFNIFSLIYIHLAFIVLYISLNLISNRFWEYIAIKFDDKEYKWYLIENTKDKVILLWKNNNYVLSKDKVQYMKTIKKR